MLQWDKTSRGKNHKESSNVVKKMKVPVTVINITQILDYNIDGHSSVYIEIRDKMLNEEESANPQNADCSGVLLEFQMLRIK